MTRTSRLVRALKWTGVTLAAALVIFIFGFMPYWLAGLLTRRFDRPDRENAGLSPASYQLAYEDVAFQAKDGTPLKGWWVPVADPRGTAVLVHGLNRSRLEMVGKVPFLHEQGWNVLVFDLRGHGESGGAVRTLGFYEREDVHAAVDFARGRSQGPVVLWGISVGAATSVLAAAEDPQVAGVVCDSSFRSLRDTTPHHLRLMRRFRWWTRVVPTWPVGDLALYWFERRTGADPDVIDVEKAAARLRPRPALFVANTGDRRMPQEIAFDLQKAAGERARVLVIPGESHGGAWREGQAPYAEAVKTLLEAAGAEPSLRQVATRRAGS